MNTLIYFELIEHRQKPYEINAVIILILQMRKLRHGRLNYLVKVTQLISGGIFLNEVPNPGFKFHAPYLCTTVPLRFGANLPRNQEKGRKVSEGLQ